ncbi:MAG: nucleotide exchange factor GrpE [Candidatus Levybacteria bacterium]|nr:nucleotide exchange factor GrpE [Candidatus Levybacteria bacterium]
MTKKTEDKKDEEKKVADKEEIGEWEEKAKDCEDKYKRALADYQNLEKRVSEERKEWVKITNKELITRLLPVLDTLELANKHVDDEGLKLSIKQFLDVLKSEGVEKIQTLGLSFDPHTMECLDTTEGEENKVVEEVRAGYRIFDKVLRPAQVRVGKSKTS